MHPKGRIKRQFEEFTLTKYYAITAAIPIIFNLTLLFLFGNCSKAYPANMHKGAAGTCVYSFRSTMSVAGK